MTYISRFGYRYTKLGNGAGICLKDAFGCQNQGLVVLFFQKFPNIFRASRVSIKSLTTVFPIRLPVKWVGFFDLTKFC